MILTTMKMRFVITKNKFGTILIIEIFANILKRTLQRDLPISVEAIETFLWTKL